MNLFKKSTAAVALVTLVSSVFTTGVSAYSTSEIEAANTLAQAGVIVDQSANPAAYNLDQNVLRQEIAAVARGIAGLDKKTTCDGVFTDVSATTPNTWACYSVEALADAGLIAKNAQFRPEANISKAEAVGMVVKAAFGDAYAYDASKGTTWQEQVVAFAVANGIVSNFTNYDTAATRGFVFEAGANAMSSTEDEEMDDIICTLLGTCGTEEDNTSEEDDNTTVTTPVVTGGNVEVSLNPASPVSQTIPRQGLVTFGKFDITAGSQDVSVNAITLKREGLSERTDIRRVYFEKNNARISTRANVSTDDTVLVSFNPALVVKAGGTETVDLVVELVTWATIGAEHAFSVQSIDSSSNLVGGTAKTGLMKIGSYVVQNVTFSNVGFGAPQYNVGESDVLLWEFRLATTGDRNNVFKSITLRNAGTADLLNSISELAIFNDGKKVSTNVAISGREVTFTVNSEIENGKTENYQIRGNVVSADRNNDTVIFELRNSTDLVVVEKATSFSAPILWVAATVAMWTSTIIGGDLLLTRDTSVGLNQTVSASTNDVVLLSAKFNPKEAVTLEDVRINYTSSVGLFSQFTSLRLLVDGRTISTYTPAASDNAAATSFTFDATFTANNATTLQVVWNVKNNATINSTFNISTFAAADLWVSSKRYVSNDEVAVINGSAQWVNLLIANSTLTLSRNDAIDSSNNTVVSGATDVTLLAFSARANDVSDVRITAINPVATYVGAGFSVTNVNNVRLYNGDTVIATRNNFDFSGLNVTIPRNSAVNFRIVADFTNTLTAANSITLNLAANAVVARNVASNEPVNAPAVAGETIAFVAGGNAVVTLNSSTVQRSIVTPSNSEASVLRFDVEAKNDKLRLTDLYVTSVGAVDLTAALRSASINVDGRKVEGTALNSTTLYFSIGNTSPLVINKDEVKTLDLMVSFNDSAARTNQAFQFRVSQNADLAGWIAVNGTSNGMRLVSESNGDELTNTTNLAVSNNHLLARSKATVARLAESNSTTAYKFTVTADANRKVTLQELVLNVRNIAQANAVFTLRKEGSNDVIQTVTQNLVVWGTDIVFDTLAIDREIAAGATTTYVVEISGVDTAANKDATREVRMTNLIYRDDVNTPVDISVSNYNLLPTTASTHKY